MKVDKFFDNLEELMPHLEEIFNDPEGKAIAEKLTDEAKVGSVMLEVYPFIARHKENVIALAAIMNECEPADVEQWELAKLAAELTKMLKGEFMLFFASCANMVRCM